MRPLTFGGFLKQYVQELSEQETLNIFRLAKEAERENPRLREPLTLYALFHSKTGVLVRAVQGSWLERSLLEYTPERMLELLEADDPILLENYKKVYRSYLSLATRMQSDDHTKALLQKRIRQLQEERGLSNYRLYRDLGLNPGNINAYLKHGDTSKVSLDTARKILALAKSNCEYADQY